MPDIGIEQIISLVRNEASKPASDMLVLVDRSAYYVEGTLEGVSEEEARICPEPGEWCICEVLLHLASATHGMAHIAETLSAGQIPDVKVTAPSVSLGPETLAELRSALTPAFEHLRTVMRALPEDAPAPKTFLHPILGELTDREWAVLGALHARDHAMQIEKVKAFCLLRKETPSV
jgi:hypothetical protein